jgi:hypothetical protein
VWRLASAANNRLARKSFSVTNTLAYYDVGPKRRIIFFSAQRAEREEGKVEEREDLIKLFYFIFPQNKLERFFLFFFFAPI